MRKYLTTTDSFVLYTTSVIGLGLIVLPSIAARHVSSWSILIWFFLGLVSYPIARVMGELGSRYPSAGGVTEFVFHAFGSNISRLTATLYLVAMLVGPPASALFFVDYLISVYPIGDNTQFIVASLFLISLSFLNAIDVETTSMIQKLVFFTFLTLTFGGILFSLPHVQIERLALDPSVTTTSILSMTFLCFHAFVGWEHAAFSSEEMKDPKSLVKAVFWSVIVVTLVFTLLAIAIVGAVPEAEYKNSNTSLTSVFGVSMGSSAKTAASIMALIIIYMMMLTWVRGGARLLYSVARDEKIKYLGEIHTKTGTPRYALVVLAIAWTISLAIFFWFDLSVEYYLKLANANYILTYVIVFVAAYKLLVKNNQFIFSTLIALVVSIALLALGYKEMWFSLCTILMFFIYRKLSRLTH